MSQTENNSKTTAAVTVRVNGDPHTLGAPASVATLVAARSPRPPFAVEVNKSLVRRGEYDVTPLADGDVVEIVTLVGGG